MSELEEDNVVTKEVLANHLRNKHQLPLSVCSEIVDQFFTSARHLLLSESKLVLTNFGSFKKVAKAARPGRNFKDNSSVTIAARDVITFTAAAQLRHEINSDIVETQQMQPGAFHSAMTQFLSDNKVSHTGSNIEQELPLAAVGVAQVGRQERGHDALLLKNVERLLERIYSDKQHVQALLRSS